MSFTIRWPAVPAHQSKSPRRRRAAAVIRQAARAVLGGAKQVGRAVFVLSVFAVMLATALALGLLIWLPHSDVAW